MALLVMATAFQSAAPQGDEVMVKDNGTYIVNTTTLGKDVIGYFGFGLLQRMGEVVIDFPNQVVYFKPRA